MFPLSQRHFSNMECFGWLFLSCLRNILQRADDSLKVLERSVAEGSARLQRELMGRRAEGAAGPIQGGCTLPPLFNARHHQCLFPKNFFYKIPTWSLLKLNCIYTQRKWETLRRHSDLKRTLPFKLEGRVWHFCLQKRCSPLTAEVWFVHGAEGITAACEVLTTGFSRLLLLLLVMQAVPFYGSSGESVLW